MYKLKVLDLFSGIGGFSLGLERTGGFETVAFCEIEPFPRRVLAKHWPDVPCFEDVRKLKGSDIGTVDLICGGYPCQPFSTAGKRKGAEDHRHLWPEFMRLVDELRPTWVIGENVAGHISMGLDSVLSDLENAGYTCRTFIIPACAVDAKHRRDRVWTVGHAPKLQRDGMQYNSGAGYGQVSKLRAASSKNTLSHTYDHRLQRWEKTGNPKSKRSRGDKQPKRCTDLQRAIWPPEPNVGRVAHGVPGRVDRLKALGNAVVPQIAEVIGYAILDAEHNK